MERLQKAIANSGYCSRRSAEEKIKERKVLVNDEIVTTLGFKVSDKDDIVVEGNLISKEKKYEYYLLNKPRGYITSSKDDKDRKVVVDIINTDQRIYPIGRLDYDTTGLLLLTNDGELTNILSHPSSNIDKTYVAKVQGILTGYDIKKLRDGVLIDGFKTSKARVKLKSKDIKKNNCIIEVTIHEGHNHQVKKMFESIGYKVLKLKREQYAFLNLKSLKVGEYRPLTVKEVKMLYNLK